MTGVCATPALMGRPRRYRFAEGLSFLFRAPFHKVGANKPFIRAGRRIYHAGMSLQAGGPDASSIMTSSCYCLEALNPKKSKPARAR